MKDRANGDPVAPTDRRQAIGRGAERAVGHHLTRRGWRILSRNWRIGAGEIDLVCLSGRTIVFVEVKALRSGGRRGPERPVLAVGPRKRERLVRLGEAWLASPGRAQAGRWDEVRFDVIGIEYGADGPGAALEHVVDAFRPEDLPVRRLGQRRRGLR